MPKKWNDATPTKKALNLLSYLFVNPGFHTLKKLSDEIKCSKQSILGYLRNIDRTSFGIIERDESSDKNYSSYSLKINKEVITLFEKRKKNEEKLKQLTEKSKEDKKFKDKSSAKKAEDQELTRKKSNISKTKSAKGKKEEKLQKYQKTRPAKKNKK